MRSVAHWTRTFDLSKLSFCQSDLAAKVELRLPEFLGGVFSANDSIPHCPSPAVHCQVVNDRATSRIGGRFKKVEIREIFVLETIKAEAFDFRPTHRFADSLHQLLCFFRSYLSRAFRLGRITKHRKKAEEKAKENKYSLEHGSIFVVHWNTPRLFRAEVQAGDGARDHIFLNLDEVGVREGHAEHREYLAAA